MVKVNVKFEVHIINSLSRESLAFRVWFWCASTSCETVDVYNSFSSMDKVFSTVITCIAIPMYVCNVLGNFLVIVVIQKDKKLRESPNTFLLLSLAHSDIWFSILAFVNVIFISKQATYAVRPQLIRWYFHFVAQNFDEKLSSYWPANGVSNQRYSRTVATLLGRKATLWQLWSQKEETRLLLDQ